LGDVTIPVLSYPSGLSGWTDDLTTFHEEVSDGNYFIDVASRQHTLSAIARRIPSESAVIMDIGCSSGYMIRDLRARFPKATVLGADYVRGPLEKLSTTMPGIPFVQFDLVQCPLPDACVDVLVLLNVLEHIENDAEAARQIYRLLRPGGIAVIEVPAGPDLYDVYDKLLLHHRRYASAHIADILRGAGFKILESSHLGFFLYPFFRHVKRRNRRYLNESLEEQKRIVQSTIVNAGSGPLPGMVMRIEAALRRWMPMPRGIRCLVTAGK
jgi:SAM-dependent methyltransferase